MKLFKPLFSSRPIIRGMEIKVSWYFLMYTSHYSFTSDIMYHTICIERMIIIIKYIAMVVYIIKYGST